MTYQRPLWVTTFRQVNSSTGALHPSYYVTFPINPESFRLDFGRNIEEVSIIGYRDIPRVGNRKLDKVSFTALLPGRYDANLCNYYPIPRPTTILGRLRRWAQSGGGYGLNPLRVTIAGLYTETMVLTDVSLSTQPAEERGDIYVDVSLTAWVDLKPKAWSYGRKPRPVATSNQAKRYVVVSGDTLWGIARRHYGSGNEWRRIWNANKPMRSGNPNLIYPGEVILLPKK